MHLSLEFRSYKYFDISILDSSAYKGWAALFKNDPSPISYLSYIRNLFLIDTHINTVTWTLKIEIIVSLFFPILYVISRHESKTLSVLAGIYLFIFAFDFAETQKTYFWLFTFYIGLSLPVAKERILRLLNKVGGNCLFVFSVTIMLGAPYVMESVNSLWVHLVRSFAISVVIIIITHGDNFRFASIFRNSFLISLGRVSYSFYLYHLIVLHFLVVILVATVNIDFINNNSLLVLFGLVFVSVAISYFVALFSYKWIEKFFITLGKCICNRLV